MPVCALIINKLQYINRENAMSQGRTLATRTNGALRELVASRAGEHRAYENISEYVRDLIRCDKERSEREALD